MTKDRVSVEAFSACIMIRSTRRGSRVSGSSAMCCLEKGEQDEPPAARLELRTAVKSSRILEEFAGLKRRGSCKPVLLLQSVASAAKKSPGRSSCRGRVGLISASSTDKTRELCTQGDVPTRSSAAWHRSCLWKAASQLSDSCCLHAPGISSREGLSKGRLLLPLELRTTTGGGSAEACTPSSVSCLILCKPSRWLLWSKAPPAAGQLRPFSAQWPPRPG
mmetsp:Transcript_10749/g.17092  ORF Transcript_10749/g.17092 Transcript_10749/m.17092 type:complete len:220 (-) Transcript_10749:131-790(-)